MNEMVSYLFQIKILLRLAPRGKASEIKISISFTSLCCVKHKKRKDWEALKTEESLIEGKEGSGPFSP
jgi:hypothetical protein